jgi:hypothetical protein
VKGEAAPPVDLTQLLQQREERFAYTVISRALERSVRGNHAVDARFFILIAAQAAIYTILLDKFKEYPAVAWALLGAFVLAILGIVLSVFVREVPNPRSLIADLRDEPEGSRRQYIEHCISNARFNDMLRAAKIIILSLTFAMTVVPLLIAIASRTRVV